MSRARLTVLTVGAVRKRRSTAGTGKSRSPPSFRSFIPQSDRRVEVGCPTRGTERGQQGGRRKHGPGSHALPSQRQPYGNLMRPACHRISVHPLQADGSEQQRNPPKPAARHSSSRSRAMARSTCVRSVVGPGPSSVDSPPPARLADRRCICPRAGRVDEHPSFWLAGSIGRICSTNQGNAGTEVAAAAMRAANRAVY